jgi:hypothetical protein
MGMLQSKGWKRQHDSKPERSKDDEDLLADESSTFVVGQSPEGLERPANDNLELKQERRWVLLDGSNFFKFHRFSAQSAPPISFAKPAPMASSMNSAGLTCPGTGARQAERT